MNLRQAPPLLSRLLLAVSSIVMVGVVFIFVSRALEPASIPPPAPPKQAQTFNPKADVSKNIIFPQLESVYMIDVPDMPMGRENPFIPVVKPTSTSAAIPAEGVAIPGSQLRIVPAQTTSTMPETMIVTSTGMMPDAGNLIATTTNTL